MSKKGLLKKILAIVTGVALFFKWINYGVNILDFFGTDIEKSYFYSDYSMNGFQCVLPIFTSAILIIAAFLSTKNTKWSKILFFDSIAGVVVLFINQILFSTIWRAQDVRYDLKTSWGFGAWISLIVYVVMIIIAIKERKKEKATDNYSED